MSGKRARQPVKPLRLAGRQEEQIENLGLVVILVSFVLITVALAHGVGKLPAQSVR